MLRKPNTCTGLTNRNVDGTFSISIINPINEKAITRDPNKKEHFIIKLSCLFTIVLNLDLVN